MMFIDQRHHTPQVSLKQLLIAFSLVGLGVGMLCMIGANYDHRSFNIRMLLPPPSLWFLGGMAIGAGAFALFKKTYQGALVGFGIQLLLLFLLGVFGQRM